MIKSDLEKLSKSELITLLLEQEKKKNKPELVIDDTKPVIDEMSEIARGELISGCDGEKGEMRVGDIIVRRGPIRMYKLYSIFRIKKQESDRVLLDRLEPEGYWIVKRWSSFVKYTEVNNEVIYLTWENKDTLYSDYEIFDKNKLYEVEEED